MVHTAARDLVIKDHGIEIWENLLVNQGFNEAEFISGNVYKDERTIELVVALSKELNIEMSEMLKKFGYHWVDYSAKTSFGSVYKLYGEDVFTFLENLDRMHDAIEAAIPEARTPFFECVGRSDKHMDIIYSSHREGLTDFVEGLLNGVLNYFETPGSAKYIKKVETGELFTIFID